MDTSYATVKKSVFATGMVPDGYFGRRATVAFALIGPRIVAVAECGWFGLGLPPVLNIREAMWILIHHPSSRAKRVKLTKA